jgi:hypothetical protein
MIQELINVSTEWLALASCSGGRGFKSQPGNLMDKDLNNKRNKCDKICSILRRTLKNKTWKKLNRILYICSSDIFNVWKRILDN